MSVYVGIDVHRKRSQVAVVAEDGQVQLNKNVVNGSKKLPKVAPAKAAAKSTPAKSTATKSTARKTTAAKSTPAKRATKSSPRKTTS